MRLPTLTAKRVAIGVLLLIALVLVISSVLFGVGSEEPGGPPDTLFTTP